MVDKTNEQIVAEARDVAESIQGWLNSLPPHERNSGDKDFDRRTLASLRAVANALTAAGVAPQAPGEHDDACRDLGHAGTICWGECLASEHTTPVYDVDKLAEVIDEQLVDAVGGCVCHEAYTTRNMRDPDCEWHGVNPRDEFPLEVARAVVAYLGGEGK